MRRRFPSAAPWTPPGLLLLGCIAGCAPPPTCSFDDQPLGELSAWEQSWLEEQGLPPASEAATLLAEDELELRYRDTAPQPEAAQAPVALIVHGSSAHGALYTVWSEGLAARGVRSRLVDLRGHGLSVCDEEGPCGAEAERSPADDARTWPGRAGDAADPEQHVRDLSRHVEDLRARWPEASVTLVGHSSGGGLVSRFIERGGATQVDGVALVAPYNHPDQPQVRDEVLLDCEEFAGTDYARLDLGALGAALRGEPHRYVLSLHKGEQYTDPLDVLSYSWNTVQGLATTDPDAFWAAYDLPLLLLAGAEDHLLDPEQSLREAERAAGPVEAEIIADTSHIGLVWSDEVAARLAAFAAER